MKIKGILIFISGFILVSITTQFILNTWTKSFTEATYNDSFQDTITFVFANGRYSYVWSEDTKRLIPPSENSQLNTFSQFVRIDDVIIKEKNTSTISLIRNRKKFDFLMELMN